jgi:hypothetical protein
MSIFSKTILTFSIVGALSFAASANTVQYTTTIDSTAVDWSKNLALEQFNPSLGTLDSIEITLSSGISSVMTAVNQAESSSYGNGQTTINITLDTSTIGSYDLFNVGAGAVLTYTGANWVYATVDNQLAAGANISSSPETGSGNKDTGILSNSTLLTDFTGSGDVNLLMTTLTTINSSVTGGSTSLTQESSAGLTATITYNYTPVPEPTTMALFGIGSLGLFLIRRRK